MVVQLAINQVPLPTGASRNMDPALRIVNANFRSITDYLNRAIAAGNIVADGSITLAMLATSAKTLAGDVTGLISGVTVEKIRNRSIAAPAAGDDGKAITYNHAGSALAWTALFSNPMTTRGDLIYRGAATPSRLAVGGANTVLKSDGTDPGWGTVTSLLDTLFSSSQGAVLYRGAASWAALAPGTSGHYLKTQGAAADPIWASVAAGSSPLTTKGDLYVYTTVDARLPIGSTDGHVLTVDAASAAGMKWAAAAAAGTNALLDGSSHTDTTASAVTRGDLIYGNSTPAWDDLALGSAGKVLKSDGTDLGWKWDRCLRADKPTFACSYGGGSGFIVNNGSGTRTAAGGTEADAADTERPSEKFTQSVNTGTSGFGYWPKKISGAMSPAIWADFKIVTASKMNLQIGFSDGGGLTANSDTTNVVTLEWQEGTDTNFRFKHNDAAGGVTDDDTGIAKDANWHDVLIYSPDAGTTWILEIDGVQTNSVTTNIPTSSTLMNPMAGYGCNGAGSTGNELRQSYVVCQTTKAVGS